MITQEMTRNLSALHAPKPEKYKKKSKPMLGICPNCGAMGRGELEHSAECVRELDPIRYKKNKTERSMLRDALDMVARRNMFWVWGNECVLKESDGGNCRGGVQWGHVLSQAGHPAIVWEPANALPQCAGHNLMHSRREMSEVYFSWYQRRFGIAVWEKLCEAGKKPGLSTIEMREKLIEINAAYNSGNKQNWLGLLKLAESVSHKTLDTCTL